VTVVTRVEVSYRVSGIVEVTVTGTKTIVVTVGSVLVEVCVAV
jgi:hypothetical protein